MEGVFTTDPNKLSKAKKIRVISYEEMLEMASLGAKVMQPVSIQDARLNRISIEVRSSFKKKTGTLITKRSNIVNNKINFKNIMINDDYIASKNDLKYFKNAFEGVFLKKNFFEIFNLKKIKLFVLEVS